MTKEELNKLSKEEIYKLYNQGKLSAEEVESLPRWEQEKLNARLFREKKAEIKALYRKGELSISDTLAYEQIILLDKNRSNTSSIVWIIVINIVIIFFGVLIINASK